MPAKGRLSAAEREQIRQMLRDGKTVDEVCTATGRGRSAIYAIRNGGEAVPPQEAPACSNHGLTILVSNGGDSKGGDTLIIIEGGTRDLSRAAGQIRKAAEQVEKGQQTLARYLEG